MGKKITFRLDDETARKIDELAARTQIPKVRLAKQAYDLLFSFYSTLQENYAPEVVNMNFIDFIQKTRHVTEETEGETV